MAFVYFIGAKDRDGVIRMVKIGRTSGVDLRLAAIQSNCPLELVVVAKVKGHAALETALHEHFAAESIRGEWFWLTAEMRAVIEALGTGDLSMLKASDAHSKLRRYIAGFPSTAAFCKRRGIDIKTITRIFSGVSPGFKVRMRIERATRYAVRVSDWHATAPAPAAVSATEVA